MKRVFALTGGIASGKSTVAAMLKDLGAAVLDADEVAHELSRPKGELWQRYVDFFGEEILLPNGELNRRRISDIVFADKTKLTALNAMAHPMIIKRLEELCAEHENSAAVVYDVPLLFETGMDKNFSDIWLVTVSKATQLERLMKRSGMEREQAERIIAAQMPTEEKRKRATVIIDNDGTREETRLQVIGAWQGVCDDKSEG